MYQFGIHNDTLSLAVSCLLDRIIECPEHATFYITPSPLLAHTKSLSFFVKKSNKFTNFTTYNHSAPSPHVKSAYCPTSIGHTAHMNTKKSAIKKRYAKIDHINLETSVVCIFYILKSPI